jgi:hypothetical protein
MLLNYLLTKIARFITPIFVGFDVFTLFLQLIGAVIVSSTLPTDSDAAKKLQMGKDIALAGISAQIGAFGLFSLVAVRFHFISKRFNTEVEKRFHATPGDKYVSMEGAKRKFNPNWRNLLFVVNLSCLLILVSQNLDGESALLWNPNLTAPRSVPSTERSNSDWVRPVTLLSTNGCKFELFYV